jgi:hypothetical protein
MSTQTPTMPTLAVFKQFSRDIAPAARAVLMARVHAELTRTRVNAYILPIFQAYRFTYGPLARQHERDEVIPTMDELYLADLDDPRMTAFYAECDAAHRAHGFTGASGHCPALEAEHLVIQVERALIDLAESVFGITADRVYGDTRTRYLELLIGAALKAEQEAQ